MSNDCGWCGVECDERIPCEGCGAVFYCRDGHARKHFRGSHGGECPRLKAHRRRVRHPSPSAPRQLVGPQAFRQPPFRLEDVGHSPLWDALLRGGPCPETPTNGTEWRALWGPGAELVPCWDSRTPTECRWSIRDWDGYRGVRGLKELSPIPALMHYPLSVYFALSLKRHALDRPPSGKAGHIEICYLGPQVESSILPAFFELGRLLAGHDIDIHLIGPEVSERPSIRRANPTGDRCSDEDCSCRSAISIDPEPFEVDCLPEGSTSFASNNAVEDGGDGGGKETRLHCHRGLYHECLVDLRPDIVFCANAGIELYDSWRPSLERMAREGTFSVLTDYTEEAVHRADRLCRSMGIRPSLSFVNPFGCPVPCDRSGIRVPCYSNGFGFALYGQRVRRWDSRISLGQSPDSDCC